MRSTKTRWIVPQLFADGKALPLPDEDPSLSSAKGRRAKADRPYKGWIDAFGGGGQSPGSFLNAGAIADAVNLGTVALRAGRKVLFDSKAMRVTNVLQANKYLSREYRKGWEL